MHPKALPQSDRRDPKQFEPFKWADWQRFTLTASLSALVTAAVTVFAMGQRTQALMDRIDSMDKYGTAVEQVYRQQDLGRWEKVDLDLQQLHSDFQQQHNDLQEIKHGQKQLRANP